jgi:hypothetical protein
MQMRVLLEQVNTRVAALLEHAIRYTHEVTCMCTCPPHTVYAPQRRSYSL